MSKSIIVSVGQILRHREAVKEVYMDEKIEKIRSGNIQAHTRYPETQSQIDAIGVLVHPPHAGIVALFKTHFKVFYYQT
jgi:hypothetical protein